MYTNIYFIGSSSNTGISTLFTANGMYLLSIRCGIDLYRLDYIINNYVLKHGKYFSKRVFTSLYW